MNHRFSLKNMAAAFGFGVVTFVLAGCGGESLHLEPVSGSIMVEGKPITIGAIRFCPDKSKGNTFGKQLTGELDQKGNYRIYCQEKDGVPLGWYKVVVFAYQGFATPPVSLINTKYNHEDTTPLAIEVVKEPSPGAYDLKLSGGASAR